jgi:hypothetical protein
MTKGVSKDRRSSKIIFKIAKQLLEEQNKSTASDRGETNRAADSIDIRGIYNGKQQQPSI